MTTIGLIGKIGAGKSTVARRLEELGAQVIDADKIAHEVLAEADVKREVVTHFGASVLGGNGELQRQVLAERVFGLTPTHAAALTILEKIVHPRVRQRINGRLDHLQAAGQATGKDAKVVLDIPLLLQAGWGDACDYLIRLECNETVRQERLKQRGWSGGLGSSSPRAPRSRGENNDRGYIRHFGLYSRASGSILVCSPSGPFAGVEQAAKGESQPLIAWFSGTIVRGGDFSCPPVICELLLNSILHW